MDNFGLLYVIFYDINLGDLDIDAEVIIDNSNNDKAG